MTNKTIDNSAKPYSLSDDEWRLVRLFRCMSGCEQHDVLVEVTLQLMKSYSIDPYFDQYSADTNTTISEELTEEPDDRVFHAWPGSWPGQGAVDLDNLGDPGFVLENGLPEGSIYHVLGSSGNDGATADDLIEMYLQRQAELYFPLPTEFGLTEEEMVEGFREAFVAFIKEWRERIVATIEVQASGRS